MTTAVSYDVAVVGGGSAGVAAALGAAASGAHTLLVERGSTLGGNVSQAYVHTLCGLFHGVASDGEASGPSPANAGLCSELSAELQRVGAAAAPERAGKVWVLPLRPPRYAHYLEARVAQAGPRLECRTGTELVAAQLAREPTARHRLTLKRGDREDAAEARCLIDASGDGVLTALGNADGEQADPERLQRSSFIFRLDRVENGALEGFARMRLSATIAGAERRGALPEGCESVLVRPGASGEVYVTVNLPPLDGGPHRPQDDAYRLAMEARGREFAEAITQLLRERYDAFRSARIDALPARLGVREGARLLGREILCEADILTGRRREDEVALSTWPIELWHDHRRAEMRYPKGASGIPLGALVSRSHPTLAMAGRCMSATHEALGALRVVGTALATGDAAGRAAALAVGSDRSLWQLDAAEVRDAIAGEVA